MQNLNLYNYYDKSLADINKDYLDALAASRAKVAPKKKSKGLVAMFFILLMAAGGGYYYYQQKIEENFVKTHYAKPSGPDLRSSEEKLGYVKVQIFEFADEPAKTEQPKEPTYESALATKIKEFASSNSPKTQERPTAYDEKKQLVDSVDKTGAKPAVKPQQTAAPVAQNPTETPKVKTPETIVPTAPVKQTQTVAKATPPVIVNKEKIYSIVFENIDNAQYDFLRKAGSIFKAKYETVGSKPAQKTVWRLYRMNDDGDILVGDKKASFIKDFNDKEEAVRFAKDNKIQSIIRSEDVDNGLYSVRFCCMNLDNAKKFAETSNITNKTIRIIREE